MSEEVLVDSIPNCDLCTVQAKTTPAVIDGRTQAGPWANMCQAHFDAYGVGLGTGSGQRLKLRPAPVSQTTNLGVKISFDTWMDALNRAFSGALGLSIHDVADRDYRSLYESGIGPVKAAAQIVKEEVDGV